MTDTPEFAWSIIVPTRDRPVMVCRLLDALSRLEAPSGGFEVVVVDDGSVRDQGQYVEPYATLLNLTFIRQANQGPAAARNAGVRASCGRWLAFTDDDCAPTPSWLVAMDRCVDASSVVGGRCVNALDSNRWSEASEFLAAFSETRTGFATTNNLGIARSAFDRVGGFDTGFEQPAGEDRAFAASARAQGLALHRCEEAVVRHAHRLDARSFWRQHRAFGVASSEVGNTMSIRDRVAMLTEAFAQGGTGTTARVVLSQFAVATGAVSKLVDR